MGLRILNLFYVAILILSVSGGLNFYISQQESLRLLGLAAELAYVRNGSIFDVAQHFIIPVPFHIQELCFVWENADNKVVKYVISVTGSNMQPLEQVSLNVSTQGVVPRKPQIFCLHLPCTTHVLSELDVFMKINFTSLNNMTILNVLMKKDCTTDGTKNGEKDFQQKPIPVDDSSHLLYVAIGVAFGVLLVSLAVASCFLCPRPYLCHQPERISGPANSAINAVYSPIQTSCTVDDGTATVYVANNDATNEQTASEGKHSIYLQRNSIAVGSVLMEGTFGCMFHATVRMPDSSTRDALIKTVKDNAAENQVKLMIEEGTKFQNVVHPNIYPLVGIVDGDGGKPLLVYPAISCGNLKRWLLYCRGSLDGSLPHPLCTQDLVTVALNILQGVQFLHEQNIIHKDLATRNCVIGDRFHAQVTDLALSRDFFPNDYHCLGDNENRPIKWMALESLGSRKEFSTASDIWSFGVVLWELTTLAQQPYVEIDPFEVCRVLRDGYRLTQPINCPDELFAIMAYCWAASTRERPTATQLYRELLMFHRQLNEYI